MGSRHCKSVQSTRCSSWQLPTTGPANQTPAGQARVAGTFAPFYTGANESAGRAGATRFRFRDSRVHRSRERIPHRTLRNEPALPVRHSAAASIPVSRSRTPRAIPSGIPSRLLKQAPARSTTSVSDRRRLCTGPQKTNAWTPAGGQPDVRRPLAVTSASPEPRVSRATSSPGAYSGMLTASRL